MTEGNVSGIYIPLWLADGTFEPVRLSVDDMTSQVTLHLGAGVCLTKKLVLPKEAFSEEYLSVMREAREND